MRLAVDIGGTFTDIALETPAGLVTAKVLTTPDAPENGVVEGVGQALARAGVEASALEVLVHGTTLATNALIERKGARTAFLTTAGVRDLLETGYEKRFEHYDIHIDKPAPLVPRERRLVIGERRGARGEVLLPLDEAAIPGIVGDLDRLEVEALAIGFLHSFAYPEHERRARELIARVRPELPISISSEISGEIREYERFSTTVANAYVQPLMAGYLGRLGDRLGSLGVRCAIFMMTSGGGLTTLEQARAAPIRLVESGPAGGAVLAGRIAEELGLDNVLAFDMGGTTAKICLLRNGEPDRARLFEVARAYRDLEGSGIPVRIPVIEMVEIGAGGGSIARVDAMRRITVGPDSTGADPGPACYGRGGEKAAVTDANLLLGKIDAERFAGGRITLDAEKARRALTRSVGEPLGLDDHWPAAGVVEMVEENMANAAYVHSVERGRSLADHSMIAMGGGAPLHAARLAQKLGIDRVIIPTNAGVGSAVGFLAAPPAYQITQSRPALLEPSECESLRRLLSDMESRAREVVEPAARGTALTARVEVDLRYRGQGHELTLEIQGPLDEDGIAVLIERFELLYREIYGVTVPDMPVEAVSWSVTVSADTALAEPGRPRAAESVAPVAARPMGRRKLFDATTGAMTEADIHDRRDLPPGATGSGPCVIVEDDTSTVVPKEFGFRVDRAGSIHLERWR